MEQYLGEIRLMSFVFPPKGWAVCNGALLPIQQNQALFTLLGVAYGGDGQTTFALPDLRGRAGMGTGTNLGRGFVLGQTGGEESHALTVAEMPSHTHLVQAYAGPADSGTAAIPAGSNAVLAQAFAVQGGSSVPVNRYSTASATGTMAASEIGSAGGNQGHENRQPYLAMNYCIAITGIFPSRN